MVETESAHGTPAHKIPISTEPFWCFPAISKHNPKSVLAACKVLDLTATLRLISVPDFRVGRTRITMSALDSGSEVPFCNEDQLLEGSIWSMTEKCYHTYASTAVEKALDLHSREPFPDRCNLTFPRMFSHKLHPRKYSNMDNCQAVVVADPLPVEAMFARLGLRELNFAEDVKFPPEKVCGPNMPPSALSALVDRLPKCLTSTSLSPNGDPIPLPHGTCPFLVGLAVHMRLVECGCLQCVTMTRGRILEVGKAIRDMYEIDQTPTPWASPLLLQCKVGSGEGVVLTQLPALSHCPKIRRLLEGIAPAGGDYLLKTRYYARNINEAFLALHRVIDAQSLRWSKDVHMLLYPVGPNEMWLNERVSFAWDNQDADDSTIALKRPGKPITRDAHAPKRPRRREVEG
jgi:hypothetical protein